MMVTEKEEEEEGMTRLYYTSIHGFGPEQRKAVYKVNWGAESKSAARFFKLVLLFEIFNKFIILLFLTINGHLLN